MLQSCLTLCDPRRQPTRLPRPWDSPGKNSRVGCHVLFQCMKVKSESEVTQSCSTVRDPIDCGPPGSSVHGIFQARMLEWVPLPSPTRDQTCVLCIGSVVLTTGPPGKSFFLETGKNIISYLFRFTQPRWFIGMWSQLLPSVNWLELVRATDLKTGFVYVQWMTFDVREPENSALRSG